MSSFLNVARSVALGVLATTVLAAVLFISAGRWDLPFVWGYIGVYGVLITVGFLSIDRDLLRERFRTRARQMDRYAIIAKLGAWVHFIGAGMDVGRCHWSDTVPPGLQIVGLAGVALAMVLVVWAMRANRFFVPDVRIQEDRGHHVITTGPYQYVRHPGYAAISAGVLFSVLGLGSWLSAIPAAVFSMAIIWRTAFEDRFLRENLDGYDDFVGRVRYRLVPGLW